MWCYVNGMVWGYIGKKPDGVNDKTAALVYLLHNQGLDSDAIEKGMKKIYGIDADAKKIIKCLPYYLGEVKSYAPNDEILKIRLMLSGDIP